jgi:shikimate kinase
MNVILCGLPMSGKTTIGQMLADQLHWDFIDTDRLIEDSYAMKTGKKKTCRQIYFEEGEAIFRALEKQHISSLKSSKSCVIAVGGGSLGDPDNIETLKKIGSLIYLKAPFELLWQRIQLHSFPAYLTGDNPKKVFHDIAKKRSPIYEQAANFAVDTSGLNKQQILDEVLQRITGATE